MGDTSWFSEYWIFLVCGKTKQKILQVQNLCDVIEQTILFAMITNSNFVTEQTTVNIDQKVVKEMRL